MKTNTNKNSQKNGQNFYNEVSGFYEKMIDLEKNLELRTEAYKNIFKEPGVVADIGCGIGLDSIALAKNGHHVFAFDPSPNMIQKTIENAVKYNVIFNSSISSFQSIPQKYSGNFDYVVSVGNTIAHLSSRELKNAFIKIYKLLKPGGKAFLHILNYNLIIRKGRRINNIAVRDGQVIIRFYDLDRSKIDFNILSFPLNQPKNFNIVTTTHYPHSKNLILAYLKNAGFYRIKLSKNFNGDKFELKESKDIFIEAYKK
ncbi:MAG: class I SAM-dependent methyltransferase [Ignavibacteria bacterium]|nr:class I SAM-dependent methyltransferase [Ignavibacteria bacterium]